jgi:hypothetical protein
MYLFAYLFIIEETDQPFMKTSLSFITLFCISIICNNLKGQAEVIKYKNGKPKVEYHLTNGMLNGIYTSYYKSGKKKAEGSFEFNNRVGEWSIWDTAGDLCYRRVYTSPYEFKITVPISFPSPSRQYIPCRRFDSCYEWYWLEENAIRWAKRTWGVLYQKDNPVLGENNRLFKVLYSQIVNRKIKGYKTKYDIDKTFKDTLDISATPIDTSGFKVIGFMLKVDWFYDTNYGLMDCRLLGICPMVVRTKLASLDIVNSKYLVANVEDSGKDTISLFWVYYPQVRPYLAKEKISDTNTPSYIQNLDDVFFWKYYSQVISYDMTGSNVVYMVNDTWQGLLNFMGYEHYFWQGKSPWD